MLARISAMIVRIAGVLALILGILFWTDVIPGAENMQNPWTSVHMLLGILVTVALIILGILILRVKGGSPALGIVAIVYALVVVGFGESQVNLLTSYQLHWIVQVVHLLLGLGAIGLGEAISARYKRATKA